MVAVADQLRRHVRAVTDRPDHARLPVGQFRHRIEQVHRMRGTRLKSRHSRAIICIGMSQRYLHPVPDSFDVGEIFRILLRRKSYDLQEAASGPDELLTDIRITGDDIVLILSTLLHMADEGAFHIDAHKVRSALQPFLLPARISRTFRQHMAQLRDRQRQSRRADCRDSTPSFILRQDPDGIPGPVAEVCPHTPMKMNIDQPRDRIAPGTIHHLLRLLHICRRSGHGISIQDDTLDPVILHHDRTPAEMTVRCKDINILNDHTPSSRNSRMRSSCFVAVMRPV